VASICASRKFGPGAFARLVLDGHDGASSLAGTEIVLAANPSASSSPCPGRACDTGGRPAAFDSLVPDGALIA